MTAVAQTTLLDLVRSTMDLRLPAMAMEALSSVSLGEREVSALGLVDDQLHAQGRPRHVTVAGLIGSWWQVATSVDSYPEAIDDYTNDLTGRDLIEEALAALAEEVQLPLRAVVDGADDEFRARTAPDGAELVGVFFDIADRPGWWWRRRPTTGPLAGYLSRVAER